MKKLLSLALISMLALPLAAFGQGTLKIGTVNMDRAFKEYSKTKEAEKKVNDAKDAAKKEFDDRTDAYKKALEEVNNLNKQLESTALSADKKTQLAKDRDETNNNIKIMKHEVNESRNTRENQQRQHPNYLFVAANNRHLFWKEKDERWAWPASSGDLI